jgi:hypothetical protein
MSFIHQQTLPCTVFNSGFHSCCNLVVQWCKYCLCTCILVNLQSTTRHYILKRNHSYLVVWAPTLLLHSLWWGFYSMACLVWIPQVKVNFLINQYCRVPALSLEGAKFIGSWHWLVEPGILMLLTGCKVFSYRNDMNWTWLIPSVHTIDILSICHPELQCLPVTRQFTLSSCLVSEWKNRQLIYTDHSLL